MPEDLRRGCGASQPEVRPRAGRAGRFSRRGAGRAARGALQFPSPKFAERSRVAGAAAYLHSLGFRSHA
eukprot:8140722-Lingulodinium_polyedra.AAC.1